MEVEGAQGAFEMVHAKILFPVPNPVSWIQQDTNRKRGNGETPLEVGSPRIPSLAPPIVKKRRGPPNLFLFSRPLPPDDRVEGSVATAVWAMVRGARMVRVHDVRATVHAAKVVTG